MGRGGLENEGGGRLTEVGAEGRGVTHTELGRLVVQDVSGQVVDVAGGHRVVLHRLDREDEGRRDLGVRSVDVEGVHALSLIHI